MRPIGTMRALTPDAVTSATRSRPFLRHAFPTFNLQPQGTRRHRFDSHLSVDGLFRASQNPRKLAGRSLPIEFVTYRPFVRLLLLPTPPRDDAVTFGFGDVTNPGKDLHFTDMTTLGSYEGGRPGRLGVSTGRECVIFQRR